MQERQLIKLLLKKNFYEKNKGKVTKTTFTNGLGNFFSTIEKAHKDYEEDLTIDDLIDLHTEKYNPALTRAARMNFETLVQVADGDAWRVHLQNIPKGMPNAHE